MKNRGDRRRRDRQHRRRLLARAGEDVTLMAGDRTSMQSTRTILSSTVCLLGPLPVPVRASEQLDFEPELALLTAKTRGVAGAAREIQPSVADVPVVTMQTACAATSWWPMSSARTTFSTSGPHFLARTASTSCSLLPKYA
jgi:hypothetical protein